MNFTLPLNVPNTNLKGQNCFEMLDIPENFQNTSLAAKGALSYRLQRLQNPKWLPGGPKMAEGVWKGVYP